VAALASELRPALASFERVRERHTLVVKRLGEAEPSGLEKRVRRALSGVPAFEARVAGIGAFREPTAGPAPVVYLAVKSPGLVRLHRRLCETFGTVPGIEGDDYVPHVTLARGGGDEASEAVERLLETEVDPVTWTVGELVFWDARFDEVTGRVSLPAR
ncbi:MAG TPA: 2'-5' RNA ligase family protein, partial [Halobacteriales archaeon]|nr:2'-5' RNA ligase family protein [Halobacteriales archaeon]